MSTIRPKAVVTGASQGIGRAIALALWRAGYDLALCARGQAGLDVLEIDLRAERSEGDLLLLPCDVGVQSEVQAFAKTICDRFPSGINLLVNNAGQFTPGGLLDPSTDHLHAQLQVNLMSAYWLTREMIDSLRQNLGQALIVNMCSIAGLAAYPPSGPYTVSKFALRGLGVALRAELLDQGVGVTTIFPGATMSASWDGVDIDPNRLMAAEDVAEAVLSLTKLSPRAVVEELVMRPQKGDL